MFFFALLVLIALMAWALRVPGWPARMRLAMAAALLFVGADHWLSPQRYLPMMPPWVPLHLEMVLFTGAAEIAAALGLLVPRLRRAAGFMLARSGTTGCASHSSRSRSGGRFTARSSWHGPSTNRG